MSLRITRNKRGFSMLELLIAIGTGTVVLILVLNAMSQFKAMIENVDQKAENESEGNIGINVILKDIGTMKFTYNSSNLIDDSGVRLFFDYYPDIPDAMAPLPTTRAYTLTVGSPAFTFLTLDPKLRSTASYSPSVAYSLTGGNAATSGSATYVGINKSSFMVNNFPDLWSYDGLLVFYSGVALRPAGAPLTKVPQTSVFFSQRNASDIVVQTFNGLLRDTHPLAPLVHITSPDVFFRKLTPMSGVQASLFLAAARPVRFFITNSSGVPTLIRQSWNNVSGWGSDLVLIRNATQVKFTRGSLASSVIDVEVTVP